MSSNALWAMDRIYQLTEEILAHEHETIMLRERISYMKFQGSLYDDFYPYDEPIDELPELPEETVVASVAKVLRDGRTSKRSKTSAGKSLTQREVQQSHKTGKVSRAAARRAVRRQGDRR